MPREPLPWCVERTRARASPAAQRHAESTIGHMAEAHSCRAGFGKTNRDSMRSKQIVKPCPGGHSRGASSAPAVARRGAARSLSGAQRARLGTRQKHTHVGLASGRQIVIACDLSELGPLSRNSHSQCRARPSVEELTFAVQSPALCRGTHIRSAEPCPREPRGRHAPAAALCRGAHIRASSPAMNFTWRASSTSAAGTCLPSARALFRAWYW